MSGFFYGVIEGFFGHQWSWRARQQCVDFLAADGFDCYLYAPKGDEYLRANWREPWPNETRQALVKLAEHCRSLGVRFGIGLSPLELYRTYTAEEKQRFKQKIMEINQLSPDILCILFDDMPGDFPALAQRQLDILADAIAVSNARQHIFCPTYYSFDPKLEEIFGPMPEHYLAQLGEQLPVDVDVFWTGNKVLSDAYTEADMQAVSSLLKRRPVLWDNYPVNDGAVISNYLHLRAYTNRPYQLREWASGHLVNPMNQPALSRLVLHSLAELYQLNDAYCPEAALQHALATLSEPELAALIQRDLSLFQDDGLQNIEPLNKQRLIAEYQQYRDETAVEIVDWLNGEYRFDPACLTG